MAFYSKWFNKAPQERSKSEIIYNTTLGTEQVFLSSISSLSGAGFFNKVLFESISTLHTCCKILSEDVGSFPIKIYKNEDDGSKTPIKDDYRYFLLHREPNAYTSHFDFFNTIEYRRNKTGNVFVKINKNRHGYIESLTHMKPDAIDLAKYKIINNKLFYFDKSVSGWVNSSEFLHFKMLPEDGAYGLFGIDPLKPLSQNLGITYKALQTIDNFYENGAVTELMFETTIPEGISGADWIKSQEDFETKHKGYSNAHKSTFLPPFTKPIRLPLNLTDAQFIETIKFNANQICAFYKISPHLVGNYESSKFNNLKELQLGYKVNTLRPILRMYREELERKLLSEEEILDGYTIEFNSDALLETDAKERLENYKGYMGIAAMSPNMVCKQEGFTTFAGGDDHYMFNQYTSLEKQNMKTAVPVDPERGAPEGNQNAVKEGGTSQYMLNKSVSNASPKKKDAAWETAYQQSKVNYVNKLEGKMKKSFAKKNARQATKTYKLMLEHESNLRRDMNNYPTYNEMTKQIAVPDSKSPWGTKVICNPSKKQITANNNFHISNRTNYHRYAEKTKIAYKHLEKKVGIKKATAVKNSIYHFDIDTNEFIGGKY